MIIFIENLCGLQIVAYSPRLRDRWALKIVRKSIASYRPAELKGPVLVVPPAVVRWGKTILGLLQVPILQQDPNALAFRGNYWRRILSDGMLTELLVRRKNAPVKEFYSVTSADRIARPVADGCAIIGSNWVEYGSMSEGAYRRHLQFLNARYPDAIHYCHPRERSRVPEEVFGLERTVRLHEPVECHLWREGVPRRLVTVCSSAVLSLVIGTERDLVVDLIDLDHAIYDGPTKDAIKYTKTEPLEDQRITVGDLRALLSDCLREAGVQVDVVANPP